MDTKTIEKLILLMKKHGLNEMEVTHKSLGTVRMSTGASMVSAPQHYAIQAPAAPQVTSAPGAKNELKRTSDDSAAAREQQIRSPFVGTYYEAASPGSEPFVKPGQKVRKGDTLCIIEAMKIMNEIEADRDCTIREIIIKNGQTLEYDQVIFLIS